MMRTSPERAQEQPFEKLRILALFLRPFRAGIHWVRNPGFRFAHPGLNSYAASRLKEPSLLTDSKDRSVLGLGAVALRTHHTLPLRRLAGSTCFGRSTLRPYAHSTPCPTAAGTLLAKPLLLS